MGALTEKLLEKVSRVIAVEKDRELVEYLKNKFTKEIEIKKLILIEGDILKFSMTNDQFSETFLMRSKSSEGGRSSSGSEVRPQGDDFIKYKLIANIPYNITGEIFRKFLQEEKIQPERMVLLIQKEVAERIVGNRGARNQVRGPVAFSHSGARTSKSIIKESILSISIKVYGTPKYINTVKRGSFAPAPNVDSAILLIENISREKFKVGRGRNSGRPPGLKMSNPGGQGEFRPQGALNDKVSEEIINEEKFFQILKAGFAHKRKILSSNLKPIWSEKTEKQLDLCNIPHKSRAENLSVKDWVCLATPKF
ncbi:MAG: Ribosomal RNA small subunit methyltransferase A [Candidatus Nomurabacteria bacterium GW2011_GWB1_37_5]|uniref:Ribosomal RNA small subunit methyltransferase A n=1 Tax=Candidatus Nomurabacteria bacterium GW2011_GWB1_37_5 TaxID=1618742 RepID=A0A0G0HB05_9BACT|nr:MAG: Ribosomal RNA small subunit methyltransferase A [Candidatus Nomurabacteria bacterium GW2011_GWB1_37_5]